MAHPVKHFGSGTTRPRGRGFSLIELVIVVVIIAIIGAIAIPKMSRGAGGAADSKVVGDLAVLRKAIDLFQAEHGNTLPAGDSIVSQLTLYSDDSGASTQASPDGTHIYGPYVRAIPALGVGQRKGAAGIGVTDAASIGWIYNPATGDIHANTQAGEVDSAGKLYSSY